MLQRKEGRRARLNRTGSSQLAATELAKLGSSVMSFEQFGQFILLIGFIFLRLKPVTKNQSCTRIYPKNIDCEDDSSAIKGMLENHCDLLPNGGRGSLEGGSEVTVIQYKVELQARRLRSG